MKIVKPLNNSSLLCVDDDGQECVIMGRGIGFGRKPGEDIDPAIAEQTFLPALPGEGHQLANQIADLPLDIVAVAATIVELGASDPLQSSDQAAVQSHVLALADHLTFALERHRDGMELTYPLRWEVTQLYPRELALGHQALEQVEAATGVRLPDDEAVAIAMHFVNAQFSGGDYSATARMTEQINRVLQVVSSALDTEVDPESMDVARFVTHLRYLFVRIAEGRQVSGPADGISASIQQGAPRWYRVAEHVRTTLAVEGVTITDNEVAYLALHVARLATSPSCE